MAGEKLYTGQANPASTAAIAPENRSLGQVFTCSQSGRSVVGGGVWVEADVFPERWQLWVKASSTLLADFALAPLGSPPLSTGWWYFTLAALGGSPIGLSNGVQHIVNSWTPSGPGNYVFTSGGFSYPFGESPLSTSGCIFRNGGASSVPPNDETFTGGRFYVDVVLDSPVSAAVRAPITVPRAAVERSRRW